MAANYTVLDGTSANITILADEYGSGTKIYSPCTTQMVRGAKLADANPMPVAGNITLVSTSWTRPADTTAYAVGDVVSNVTTGAALFKLANVTRTAGGSGYIVRAQIATDQKSNPSAYTIHLFNNSTATISNDNAPNRELYADLSKRIGSFNLGPMTTGVDTTNSTMSRAQDNNLRVPFTCEAGSQDLWFSVETLTANTPANGQAFTVRIWSDNN